jgi:hypothetical protein
MQPLRQPPPAARPAPKLAAGTRGSVVVDRCQVCGGADLEPVLFLGYLPPVNGMPTVGTPPQEQAAYPAQMLLCRGCRLVQLGLIVDPALLFPPEYPYTSGTTRLLRDNFAELYREVMALYPLVSADLVIDVGSNDGTLLDNFRQGGHRTLGIEPTDAGRLARGRGVETLKSFFDRGAVAEALRRRGKAKLVTAANVFAHMEDVHAIVANVLALLRDDGLFVSESHYLAALLETTQYDTVYHEHLRYYSLASLKFLLERHGLEVVHARPIPSHGGSIRVYAARAGRYPVRDSVAAMLRQEETRVGDETLRGFRRRVADSKLALLALLRDVKAGGARVFGVGAPSRASTLINYVGLDDAVLDCVVEIAGSYKIGKYIPGTLLPVRDEAALFAEQPEYALLLSWHLADELMPKLTARGFRGRYIVPLPTPRVVEGGA